MAGGGTCMVRGVWWGAYMADGGGRCGRGACMVGGVHGRGACIAGGGCVWQGGMHATPPADTTRYGQ